MMRLCRGGHPQNVDSTYWVKGTRFCRKCMAIMHGYKLLRGSS